MELETLGQRYLLTLDRAVCMSISLLMNRLDNLILFRVFCGTNPPIMTEEEMQHGRLKLADCIERELPCDLDTAERILALYLRLFDDELTKEQDYQIRDEISRTIVESLARHFSSGQYYVYSDALKREIRDVIQGRLPDFKLLRKDSDQLYKVTRSDLAKLHDALRKHTASSHT